MNRRHFLGMAGAGCLATALAACMGGASGARQAESGRGVSPIQFAAMRRKANTRFGSIAYAELGRGDAALFLHGFPLNAFQWRDALVRLSPYRRCIAPDFLGLGFTEVAQGQDVGPDAQTEMLVALLDALAIDRVDVIANDSGGAVAQLLLVRHPQRVRTLLLTNCDTEIDSPPPALLPVIELAKRGEFADAWLGRWLADKRLARSPEGIGGMCYADPSQPDDAAIETYFAPLLANARSKAMLHAYAIGLERNALLGCEAALQRSRVPTRIVWGMGDTIFSTESPGYLDRSFGNSQGVRRLPHSKLFWPEERPEVIVEEARRLWKV